MSTPYPSTSPFGPAGPTGSGTSYGMGAEGAYPTPLQQAQSTSQAPATPTHHAAMDPATYASQMAAGSWAMQNNTQHAIQPAPMLAHQWSRPQVGLSHPPHPAMTMPQPAIMRHDHGPATYGYATTIPACCSNPMQQHGLMSPVPMQPLSPMGYEPFNAVHAMQPYAFGPYGSTAPATPSCIMGQPAAGMQEVRFSTPSYDRRGAADIDWGEWHSASGACCAASAPQHASASPIDDAVD